MFLAVTARALNLLPGRHRGTLCPQRTKGSFASVDRALEFISHLKRFLKPAHPVSFKLLFLEQVRVVFSVTCNQSILIKVPCMCGVMAEALGILWKSTTVACPHGIPCLEEQRH